MVMQIMQQTGEGTANTDQARFSAARRIGSLYAVCESRSHSAVARRFAFESHSAVGYGERAAGAAGGALGLLAYWWIIVAVTKREPDAASLRPDDTVVALTMRIALATGILCGLAPALHASRRGVADEITILATLLDTR